MEEEQSCAPKPRTIIECFEEIPDPRVNRTRRHRLLD